MIKGCTTSSKKTNRMSKFFSICMAAFSIAFISCNNNSSTETATNNEKKDSMNIKEDKVEYSLDTVKMIGYVAYDANKEGKRPIVLVVHEWWGLTEYPRMRAKKLAELGYLAMAVDLYGNGKTADNPTDAQNLAMPFYQNPQIAYQRLMAAEQKVKTLPQADSSQVAAIGYCFGGGMVLNAAKLGADTKGVVSFHGSLSGVPAKKDLLKSSILVCHGAADPFVPQKDVDAFKKSMDSIHADYTFKAYPGALHAFTNPAATEMGKKFNMPIAYSEAADSTSWNDMKAFFSKIFK
jgi:dienelactone hydrolase